MKKHFKIMIGAAMLPVLANLMISKRAAWGLHRMRQPLLPAEYPWRYGKIHYVCGGRGTPVLLIHGGYAGANLMEWEEVLRPLAKHHRVYALDLLGFGRSETPCLNYSAYLLVTLINDFIRDVIGQPTQVIASGCSSIYLLSAWALSPSLYTKMLLVSPANPQKDSPRFRNAMTKRLLEMPIIGTSLYHLRHSRRLMAERFSAVLYNKKAASRSRQKWLYNSAHAQNEARFVDAARLYGYLDALIPMTSEKINIPIRVVWGRKSFYHKPFSFMRTLRSRCSDLSFKNVRDAGLFPQMENPKKFLPICTSFFE